MYHEGKHLLAFTVLKDDSFTAKMKQTKSFSGHLVNFFGTETTPVKTEKLLRRHFMGGRWFEGKQYKKGRF